MNSFYSVLLRYAQEDPAPAAAAHQEPAVDSVALMRRLCREKAVLQGFEELSDYDCRLLYRISSALFLDPTRFSRDLAAELTLGQETLARYYRLIRNVPAIQDVLTYESPRRRRVSFLRRELLPQNAPWLKSMFDGEVCLPNHVEFHPALMCNLRCKACPNCKPDGSGEWNFLAYPKLGQALTIARLRMIGDLFLEMGVRHFSFGGGGEPSLSELALDGITHLRNRSREAEMSFYTNGIFPPSWTEESFDTLVSCLNKVRFSIDAANAQEWSRYKGRPAALFEVLWANIGEVIKAKERMPSSTRIGASCLVSDLTCNDVETFLERAKNTGLDFCDIKAVETCFGDKGEYSINSRRVRDTLGAITRKVRAGDYAPMQIFIDDGLLPDEPGEAAGAHHPGRCWVAVRGRMLTVGPYGELYPCSDTANPGAEERSDRKRLGQLIDFSSPAALGTQFKKIWSESLSQRQSLSRQDCSYCVPSHNNYNAAIEKLYQDWEFGIPPEAQPFSSEPDPYQRSHGA